MWDSVGTGKVVASIIVVGLQFVFVSTWHYPPKPHFTAGSHTQPMLSSQGLLLCIFFVTPSGTVSADQKDLAFSYKLISMAILPISLLIQDERMDEV